MFFEGDACPLYFRDDTINQVNSLRIKTVIDNLTNGFFNNVDPNEFVEIRNKLLQRDEYFVLKDFDAYVKAHFISFFMCFNISIEIF